MSVEIKIPTINGLTLNTKNKRVKDDIAITIGIPRYDGSASNDVTPDIDKMIAGQLTSFTSYSVTYIGGPGFSKQPLTKAILPNVTMVANDSFSSCSKLVDVHLPNCTNVGISMFRNCTSLPMISLPKVSTLNNNAFYQCTSLKTAYFKSMTKLAPAGAFEYCKELSDIYLGYDGVVTLPATTVLNSRDTATTQGYINVHVKSQYADQYVNATNWNTLIESGFVKIIGDYVDEVE